MPVEAQAFVDAADEVGGSMLAPGGGEHTSLRLGGRRVLLVRAGIGLVNAASAAAVALAAHRTRVLVSGGSAGGLGAGVRVGDVVVGDEHTHSGADARAFGYALGQVPGMPATYPADEELRDRALAAAGTLPAWPVEPGVRVLRGDVVSGDVFVDAERVAGVRAAFPAALATDMESAALAQVAHLFGVPFLSVRGISDLCSPVEAGEFTTHVDDAADRSAAVVRELLRSLPADS
ncbi:5'-methylthioadenosine/S-adenosylhomocysteine nucleosidase [Cellulomonas palmilytica]|nr:5'-methylthioadenosine/S-adenosylhomocysteine nucleosidase [Cellulomonas palmilytica]